MPGSAVLLLSALLCTQLHLESRRHSPLLPRPPHCHCQRCDRNRNDPVQPKLLRHVPSARLIDRGWREVEKGHAEHCTDERPWQEYEAQDADRPHCSAVDLCGMSDLCGDEIGVLRGDVESQVDLILQAVFDGDGAVVHELQHGFLMPDSWSWIVFGRLKWSFLRPGELFEYMFHHVERCGKNLGAVHDMS